MSRKVNILVLFGGKSAEHEISVLSARSITEALSPERFNVMLAGISRSGHWVIGQDAQDALRKGVVEEAGDCSVAVCPGCQEHSILVYSASENTCKTLEVDIVFPVLHGTFGEDGTIQGLLEMADIPYVGDGVLASASGMDKTIMKDIWKNNGLPVLPCVSILRHDLEENLESCLESALQEIGLPCFVKPANSGSSVGITRADTRQELLESMLLAAKFDRKIMVEAACPSPREVEIGVIGNDVPKCSVPGEISYSSRFYDYKTKYQNDGSPQLLIPAPIPVDVATLVEDLAKRAWRAADLNGLARIDFLLSKDGRIWLNEVNTLPGFTQFSMFTKLWEAAGVSYSSLLEELIELAFSRYKDKRRNLVKP